MNQIKLTIPGAPIAKKRPRFVRRGGFVGTYNCQETEEGRWLWEVRQQWTGAPLAGPVELDIEFCMPIPKSASKKAKAAMLDGTIKHTKKIDIDNAVKFAMDCANGVLWQDDCQVIALSAKKYYSESPKTILTVRAA